VRSSLDLISRTGLEVPVVADIEGDCTAEMPEELRSQARHRLKLLDEELHRGFMQGPV
jgi:hypothetical protein